VPWVVLEPTKAEAVLTETVDDGFWAWLARTHPSPTGSASQSSGHDAPGGRWALQPSKHRGTVFLVDPPEPYSGMVHLHQRQR
jgi:hypothetical protein